MTLAPEPVYTPDWTETLSDFREYVGRCPQAIYLESDVLARLLKRPVAEVEAAREWLVTDGLEVRA